MRFTITALGSAGGRSVGQVVDDIVRYLEGPKKPPPTAGLPRAATTAASGPSGYYADANAEPGRWLGNGAAEMGLRGQVDGRDFARVLAGRDPHHGVRLITAQGSAGRRPTLARGTQTRWDANGEPLYDIRDTAAALKLEVQEVERMLGVGGALAVRRLAVAVGTATLDALAEPEGSYLVPTIDAEGNRWVSETELQRCEVGRAAGPDPAAVGAAGQPGDLLALAEAARAAGVSARYLRGLAGSWERHREVIEMTLAQGREPGRQYLVAYRGTKGQWLVRRSDLVDYLRRRKPPGVRVGFDLTLTTEKSLGVLALLGDEPTRRAVLDAIQAGNDRGMAHLEYAAAMVRNRGEPVSTRGWTVASFRHLTSRALDPFPHHHNVVANTAADPEGHRRALDARFLYRHAGEASALATAEMRHQLIRTLGVRWRRGRKGGWEIAGIPDEILREFSRRSNEIDDAVAELEALIGRTKTVAELRGVVVKTRPAKRQADPEQLFAGWWARARALGFSPVQLERSIGRPAPAPAPDAEEVFARLAAPDGLCATASIFTRPEVLAALNELSLPGPSGGEQPLLLPADEMAALADDFLASDRVVELLPPEGTGIKSLGDQPLFTTAGMLEVQARILHRWRSGRSVGAALVSNAGLAGGMADHELTDEQRDLVVSFCTSGDRAQAAIGRAGAGKTTAMRASAHIWTGAGYRVFGSAVKGEAARHLGQAAGIPAETLAWHLAHTDPATSPLDARSVLIVDEASTISDRDLDRLLWLAEQTGATVRLIGDPAQHGAVGAGGMFAALCSDPATTTPELRQTHRVLDHHDRAAAQALLDGRVADALTELEAAGHLHLVADEVDLYLDLLDRWWRSHLGGEEHPMVDRRNHTRFQLNRLAHRLLQVTGQVGSEEITAGRDRRFSVGDRVVARKGDRTLYPPGQPADYVRNGARGTIVAIRRRRNRGRDMISVAFDDLGNVQLPRAFFDEDSGPSGRTDVGLDHAYAVTSYAVQGATFGESTSRIDENTSRSEAYVDITRGRSANHLYLTRSADPLDGERLPKAPPPPLDATVGHRLSASGPERAAIDVDPSAAGAHCDFRREVEMVEGRDAQRRYRQAARVGSRRVDAELLRKLPARRSIPYLAHQWDETVSRLATYLGCWGVSPVADGSEAWDWALGPAPTDPEQVRERHEVTDAIVQLTVSDARESLQAVGSVLPVWARWHLELEARLGRCVQDPHRLIDLYSQISHYRQKAEMREVSGTAARLTVEEVLGPVPADPVLRSLRRTLLADTLTETAPARPAATRP